MKIEEMVLSLSRALAVSATGATVHELNNIRHALLVAWQLYLDKKDDASYRFLIKTMTEARQQFAKQVWRRQDAAVK